MDNRKNKAMKKTIEKIKLKVIGYFCQRAKIWGVDFESRFPSEFVISRHAEQRIQERVNVSEQKMMKMVVKAWYSRLVVPKVNMLEYRQQFSGERDRHAVRIRYFMGYIWIFRMIFRRNCAEHQKFLVTVYKA
jgi:hypothetical protein